MQIRQSVFAVTRLQNLCHHNGIQEKQERVNQLNTGSQKFSQFQFFHLIKKKKNKKLVIRK